MKRNHRHLFANRGMVVFIRNIKNRYLNPDLKKSVQKYAKVTVVVDFKIIINLLKLLSI